MGFVTPKLALGVFLFILAAAAIAAWWMSTYNRYDQSTFHTFIAVLAGLGVFVTFMFYYSVVELQQQQQQLAVIQETARISDIVFNDLLSEIDKASIIVPNFTLSLTPLLPCGATAGPDPVTPEACIEKLILSTKIFGTWQDIIISNTFVDYQPVAYVTNFLQQANSSQLLDQWSTAKINFNSRTQSFGDLLFEYGLPITDQVPNSYVNAAYQLLADPRYIAIIT